jgi:methionyl aminopeptidase
MMNNPVPSFSDLTLVKLKDEHWLARQKVAGQCVAKCLARSRELIEAQTPNLTLKDLEAECLQIILSMKCTPTFLGYKGFPGVICASINTQLVHGIPSEYVLQPGDVVKVDLGATYQGAIADAAITAIYGAPKSPDHLLLVESCRDALANGIKAVAVGKRIGAIGNAIQHVVKRTRFGLITDYGGHGLDENTPHAEPFVANKALQTSGVRIQPGMTLAIEPMVVLGSDTRSWVSSDGWTVNTNTIGAHFEHTIYVSASGVQVLTQLES